MTLAGVILERAKVKDNKGTKYTSPPPESEEAVPDARRPVYKYAHVRSVVDAGPPAYDPARLWRHLPTWRQRIITLYAKNIDLLTAIKTAHYDRGRVDSRWSQLPPPCLQYYKRRVDSCKRTQAANLDIYKRILGTNARVVTTATLRRDWARNREAIISRAQNKFVLFPPVSRELIEDAAFAPPPGVQRPRVYLTLREHGRAPMGELRAELFTDVCPNTCRLFLQLLDGDGLGHGYVGTCFFRKVPGLYWTGGDVIYNNGCGCYAQPGLRVPIGAENYHFSHSMPGLLSMRVTCDNEMCGMFNITFKPMPQFDLRAVVFGRIIRPCSTFSAMQGMGAALSVLPVVELSRVRRRVAGGWRRGEPNRHLAAAMHRIRD